jgi:lycopene cyclase domain-containing protein
MSEHYTYLWINIFTIIFPLIFSFHPRIRFYKKWKHLFPGLILVAVSFIIWDMIFTGMGIWYFNPSMVTGIKIGNLPLEEVLFFITIPYSCIFLYEAVSTILKPGKFNIPAQAIFYLLVASLIIVATLNFERIYTFTTFYLLATYLLLSKYVIKIKYWNVAVISYIILLIPFFIVNGYLTGMFTEEAVVMYNNQENMGIRMGTIPVEDTFYGLLLFLLNVNLFEYFKKSFESKQEVLSD